MKSHPSILARGYTAALLAAVLLSTTSVFIRHLTQTYAIPPLVLAFWRDVFVVLTLVPVLKLARPGLLRLERRHQGYLIVYGFVLAVFNALWTLSVALNGAAVATVLVYCSAAFTVLLGWWLLKESLGWVKILAVVLCLGGCVLVAEAYDATVWSANLIGILTGVLAGLSYAVYSLMGRSASQRGLNPWTTLLYTFAFATLFLLLINLLPGGSVPGAAAQPGDLLWLGNSLLAWTILIVLAAGPTVLGFGAINVSLTLLPSSVANLVLTSEPVFTALIAFTLLGERLTPVQIAGSLVILSGVVSLRVYDGWLAKSQPARPGQSQQAAPFRTEL
jgi:drug/metabolite transporter (DMT)-like permease